MSETCGIRRDVFAEKLSACNLMVDETLDSRKNGIPAAKEIIAYHTEEFNKWLQTREFVPVIQSFKERLEFLQSHELKNLQTESYIY